MTDNNDTPRQLSQLQLQTLTLITRFQTAAAEDRHRHVIQLVALAAETGAGDRPGSRGTREVMSRPVWLRWGRIAGG